ncbi:MAG TPA: hypothetical protein VM260_07860 [Pirellula sp.]|nr:hypothetical protein [Pirellula sp.]
MVRVDQAIRSIGGLLGYLVYKWLLGAGFYGLMLPGGLLGMGAGFFKTNTGAVTVVCGFLNFSQPR